jgi:hypothetical protein
LSEPQAVSARAPAAMTAIAALRPKRVAFTWMYPFQGFSDAGRTEISACVSYGPFVPLLKVSSAGNGT